MYKVIWSGLLECYVVKPVEYSLGGAAVFTGTQQECEDFVAKNDAW